MYDTLERWRYLNPTIIVDGFYVNTLSVKIVLKFHLNVRNKKNKYKRTGGEKQFDSIPL